GAVPVKVIGGGPTGVFGDELNLTATGVVTFVPGPEADDGGFNIAGSQPVSYDEVEDANVNLAGFGLIAQGTNADDDITVVGLGVASFDLSVNAGPAITYSNATSFVVIQALSGDDDVDVEQGVAAFAVSFTLVGGPSTTSGGDILTLTGTLATESFSYSPTGIGTGFIVLAGGTSVSFSGTEQAVIEGFGGSDDVTHATLIGVHQVTYTPGSASDAGTILTREAGAGVSAPVAT
ncbi:MAG: hypothetical protein FD127_4477, partial [Acidimicrobiaceae bacterium]